MATSVSITGHSHTIPDVVAPFSTQANIALAEALSKLYFGLQAAGNLYVSGDFHNPGLIPPGDVGEIAIFDYNSSPLIALPFGFSLIAIDQSATDPTIVGGGSLFVGNNDTTYWGTPAQGTVSITAGNGNDLISLPIGTYYDVAIGNGHDTINANGSGTVTGGSGGTLFFVGGAADDTVDQNLLNSHGNNDTIVAGAGSVTINAYGANTSVFGGTGSLEYLGHSPGSPTIWGGSGTETLFGSSGQNITYKTGSELTPGADILAAGTGNETLNAGGASVGVQLAAGLGTVDMIGSTGNDQFFGGSGVATMTGNGGDDIFNFASASEPGGQHGGTNIITDFNTGNDIFSTIGYGASAAQNALAAATVSGGNTTLKLSDGTTIEFLGITTPNSIKYTST
jgi:Ca2+-binding RTX toxin-like protein